MKLRSSLVLVSLFVSTACAQEQPPQPALPPVPGASAPATQPATNPADAAAIAAVHDALGEYNKAVRDGNADGIEAALQLGGDTQKKMVAVAKTLVVASHDLYAVTLEKFGKEALEKGGVIREQFPSAFPELPIDQAKIKIDGAKAAVRFGPDEAGPAVLTLVKVGEKWKLSGDELLGNMTEQQFKEQSGVIGAVVAVMSKTAADVKSGKIEAPDEVVVLWNHRVQKAVNEARAKQVQADSPMLPPEMMGPATGPAAPAMPELP